MAISGTTIEFGVNYAAIGLPTNFSATPYSTNNLDTNSNLGVLAQQSYASNSVGPLGSFVTQVSARVERSGVTVGWLTHGELGNLGFALFRQRGEEPPRRCSSFQRGAGDRFRILGLPARDPEGCRATAMMWPTSINTGAS